MKARTLSRSSFLIPALVVAVVMAISNTAHAAAANGGQPLPWEGPLNQVLASFTGPVAKALCILSIVLIGFGFAFSEGGGMRRMLGLLLGVSIAVTATASV
jgi:type IV secretion system protein VirB2